MTRLEAIALLVAATACKLDARAVRIEDERLPDGRLRSEAILKADYQRSIEDLERLIQLAQELKAELQKYDYHVLSIKSVRAAEELERLARRIRNRLKRF